MARKTVRMPKAHAVVRFGSALALVAATFFACSSEDQSSAAGGSTATTPTGGGGGATSSGQPGGGEGATFLPDPEICAGHAGEIICVDDVAITCDADGKTANEQDCGDEVCLPGTGCVLCLAGQFSCHGNEVLSCNTGPPLQWDVIATCDPLAAACNPTQGACVPLTPTGGTTPTGTYYQYARFLTASSAFLGGCDVDSYQDLIYVNRDGAHLDAYSVELLDSDGDGEFEPNQHPDNPDDPGPIEERVLTLVQTYDVPELGPINRSEIYALADRVYFLDYDIPGKVFMYVFGTGVVSTAVDGPPTAAFPMLGHDETDGTWFASLHYERQVFSYHAPTQAWVAEFKYPDLSGDHMDGIEVVTDPNTGMAYVYVTDMTSDFLGQYRRDRGGGWVQENLFEYAGTADHVEGMGFGALNHFWATGWDPPDVLYEIGGGDLAKFTEPDEPPPR